MTAEAAAASLADPIVLPIAVDLAPLTSRGTALGAMQPTPVLPANGWPDGRRLAGLPGQCP